ncbi:Hypoxia-inducible lipid droplet-associated protein [Manis javanica]|nr:Hypoxia-inducible lipid droplet-associated protein [Manis javanica]
MAAGILETILRSRPSSAARLLGLGSLRHCFGSASAVPALLVGGLSSRLLRFWLLASGPFPAFLPRGSRGPPEGSSAALQRSGILSAMNHMLNLYLLGVVVTLLSIFVRLMESLEGLLENPSPGSFWTTRGQLASTETPRAFQTIRPEGCDKTSLHRL